MELGGPKGFSMTLVQNNVTLASDSMGNAIQPIVIPMGATQTMYQCYEGDVTVATSPVTLSVETDLGRKAIGGYVWNISDADCTLQFSFDGTTFGDNITLYAHHQFQLLGQWALTSKIKLTRGSSDSAYQVVVV